MGDENVGCILEQMAGSDHLLHRANQKLNENKTTMKELWDKVRAGEIRLSGANKLITKLQGEQEQHKEEIGEMNREGEKAVAIMREWMEMVEMEVTIRENERAANKANLEALKIEINRLQVKLAETTGKNVENVKMVIDRVDKLNEERRLR